MAKILWLGDAGAHTGFARVTEEIGNRLVRDHGHEMTCLAVNWRGDPYPTAFEKYVPNALDRSDIYGMSRFVEVLGATEPDVVVILNDPNIVMQFLLDNPWDTKRILLAYRPILAYLPIDGYNLPRSWSALHQAMLPVAMSRFGKDAIPGSKLVYHGVDTNLYRPIDKKTAKIELGFDPDKFLVLRVDKNSIRKNYADTWRALRPVLRKYKDIAVHFHCLPNQSDGVNLQAFTNRDEDIRDRLTFSSDLTGWTGWAEGQLPLLYSAADLFLSTSFGEGFGLTIAEALACGTPVVASDCSSIPEVVGPGGILVPTARPFTAPAGHEQMLPDIGGFTEAIEHLYLAGGVRRKLGLAATEHVRTSFSWDFAGRRFSELITELAEASQPQEEAHGPEVPNLHRAAQGV